MVSIMIMTLLMMKFKNFQQQYQNWPQLASYREAISSLENVLSSLESKGNSKTANELSKVICQVESDWLERGQVNPPVESQFITESKMKNWTVRSLCFEKDSMYVPVCKIRLCLSYYIVPFQLNYICIPDA